MTPEQQQKFKDAIGDGSDWPKFTDDAEVNYEVDRHESDKSMPTWSEATDADKALYLEEIELFRNLPDAGSVVIKPADGR